MRAMHSTRAPKTSGLFEPPHGMVGDLVDVGVRERAVSDWLARRHTAVLEEDFSKEPLRNRLSILLTRTNHLSYHISQTSLARK